MQALGIRRPPLGKIAMAILTILSCPKRAKPLVAPIFETKVDIPKSGVSSCRAVAQLRPEGPENSEGGGRTPLLQQRSAATIRPHGGAGDATPPAAQATRLRDRCFFRPQGLGA
jgi:hypothetical protein